MKRIVILLTAITMMACNNNSSQTEIKEEKMNAKVNFTQDWDKTFPQSDKVNHQKVSFKNRYGITLVGDLYTPKNASGKLPAIAVSGPFGAVKEQSSGLYAQTMAERGFITLAFDPSYTGESGGEPRAMASPDINTEDFSAAVDFLGLQKEVNREQIGIIGICGFGGQALNAVAMDTRVKAVATSVLYDMSRSIGWGVGDQKDGYTPEQRQKVKQYLNELRWKEAETGERKRGFHELGIDPNGNIIEGNVLLPKELPANPHPVFKNFHDYYRTERGYHERSINSNTAWLATMPLSYFNIPMMSYANEINIPTLIIAGEKAHSRYMSEDAFKKVGSSKKELLIIPNATHTDLYDNKAGVIPFDKLEAFFKENMK